MNTASLSHAPASAPRRHGAGTPLACRINLEVDEGSLHWEWKRGPSVFELAVSACFASSSEFEVCSSVICLNLSIAAAKSFFERMEPSFLCKRWRIRLFKELLFDVSWVASTAAAMSFSTFALFTRMGTFLSSTVGSTWVVEPIDSSSGSGVKRHIARAGW
eukprot:CAMPEP_0181474336 /NCGR_PEP_ID=MMETSP1110-20121109/40597_1 /TAXON_ID=174948 /ORGANISM="Symbiodinium sp., Strain CCMP421" /LENGTH=160 /DNA_ID=CAMNT_0023599501 /DNA_START=462 /DNA_END=945 /DNA_ORIENTATION=+